ncbi:uncharacterized protein PHALS_03374 [Plasmopara halstedii]|uniref:Uncharacterized protein n=1 Tax=Plasmopara halstedii TaxID=4781 RepID=A0A0P1A7R9_PLAHL|nr:uncharacterized protein PHALS_03374 [Plasmopara halstedii]CEG36708.1 hypothetical protein PHALS_03374 [Plasmopara halstedii]|eukprot:XP_024573077.1 hypothetical protein PHALS_03374 [Plasmopara halstedii]
MEEIQLYAEALKAWLGDIVTVRLAMGTLVTAPKVPVDFGVKFLDLDSVERCLVLDLDASYNVILGMAWLEHHELWIDWRSNTLGATCTSPGGALMCHEPTSARRQKRYWREHWAEVVNMLDIEMSELVDTNGVSDRSPERGSWTDRRVARNPLSAAQVLKQSLHVMRDMVDQGPRYRGRGPLDACEVARKPLDSALVAKQSLHAIDGVVGQSPMHLGCGPSDARGVARYLLDEDCGIAALRRML